MGVYGCIYGCVYMGMCVGKQYGVLSPSPPHSGVHSPPERERCSALVVVERDAQR